MIAIAFEQGDILYGKHGEKRLIVTLDGNDATYRVFSRGKARGEEIKIALAALHNWVSGVVE